MGRRVGFCEGDEEICVGGGAGGGETVVRGEEERESAEGCEEGVGAGEFGEI